MPDPLNTDPKVDAWFADADHPLLPVMQEVRRASLSADRRITECIKWKSPTFVYQGNIASINPRAKRFVQLMFHQGAQIPGEFVHLEGGGQAARYMNFESLDQLNERREELQEIIRAWCAMKDA